MCAELYTRNILYLKNLNFESEYSELDSKTKNVGIVKHTIKKNMIIDGEKTILDSSDYLILIKDYSNIINIICFCHINEVNYHSLVIL